MNASKRVRVTIPLFSILLISSLCTAGCSATEQTDDNQIAQTHATANNNGTQKGATQTGTDENDSQESKVPVDPSVDYTDGVVTLDGVSVDIPDSLTLSDVQDSKAKWSDGSGRRELLISSIETPASSSDMTQRKVAEYLYQTAIGWQSARYEGESILVCESFRRGRTLADPSLSDALDENSPYDSVFIRDFYTAGSEDGSFVKLSFITRYNNAHEVAEDYEWPEGAISAILDSLQSKNDIAYKYDMPEEPGLQTPEIAAYQISYSYDTYWEEGYFVVKVSLSNPSFLAWRGKVTVTCRDSHDKVIAKKTNYASCKTLNSFDSIYFDDWDNKANLGIYMPFEINICDDEFIFSDDKVRTTPAKVEVTLE